MSNQAFDAGGLISERGDSLLRCQRDLFQKISHEIESITHNKDKIKELEEIESKAIEAHTTVWQGFEGKAGNAAVKDALGIYKKVNTHRDIAGTFVKSIVTPAKGKL
ncbi:hypothetical protein HB904_17045 [Listeria booriae]|uniref:Uncharacterized protein n=1 Tax=Listeria booriae TaxID=1552123 RepID=A0A841YNT5_9LIST|nr:hypothetical protein [Listeria booriae]MBC1402155.1 hypothetical protein [Listeria booriae]MBC1617887.1 hypothetical protein [Listeria booriae]